MTVPLFRHIPTFLWSITGFFKESQVLESVWFIKPFVLRYVREAKSAKSRGCIFFTQELRSEVVQKIPSAWVQEVNGNSVTL